MSRLNIIKSNLYNVVGTEDGMARAATNSKKRISSIRVILHTCTSVGPAGAFSNHWSGKTFRPMIHGLQVGGVFDAEVVLVLVQAQSWGWIPVLLLLFTDS